MAKEEARGGAEVDEATGNMEWWRTLEAGILKQKLLLAQISSRGSSRSVSEPNTM
jgi:hypothetical protein